MPDLSDAFDGADAQDSAEAFDESNLDEREAVGEMRTFEEMPDLLDLTQAEGDRDDEEALALDADEFDEAAIDPDAEFEQDNELDYRAATDEHEDDLDGQGAVDSFDEDGMDVASSIEGLDEEVADADLATGGEDDVSNFQARNLGDEDLKDMGYSEGALGHVKAKPD